MICALIGMHNSKGTNSCFVVCFFLSREICLLLCETNLRCTINSQNLPNAKMNSRKCMHKMLLRTLLRTKREVNYASGSIKD